LSDSVIFASCDLDERPARLSGDSSDHEEFELAINSDSDGGDTDYPDEEEAYPESLNAA
jgi:hypothetical protein